MLHLHIRRQELLYTKDNPHYTDLEYKSKINVVFFTSVDPSKTKEGIFYCGICGQTPPHKSEKQINIHHLFI